MNPIEQGSKWYLQELLETASIVANVIGTKRETTKKKLNKTSFFLLGLVKIKVKSIVLNQ